MIPTGFVVRAEPSVFNGIAEIAERFGSGTLRLTVWQNLLISGVRDENIAAARTKIEAAGLRLDVSNARAGLPFINGSIGADNNRGPGGTPLTFAPVTVAANPAASTYSTYSRE